MPYPPAICRPPTGRGRKASKDFQGRTKSSCGQPSPRCVICGVCLIVQYYACAGLKCPVRRQDPDPRVNCAATRCSERKSPTVFRGTWQGTQIDSQLRLEQLMATANSFIWMKDPSRPRLEVTCWDCLEDPNQAEGGGNLSTDSSCRPALAEKALNCAGANRGGNWLPPAHRFAQAVADTAQTATARRPRDPGGHW